MKGNLEGAIWCILEYIDDKPGTRTLFHELMKLYEEYLGEEE